VKYWSPIDPHVHLRWDEYADQKFLQWGLADAHDVGLAAVMEMGNTTPQITDEETLEDRCDAVDRALGVFTHGPLGRVAHYVHPGLTDRVLPTTALFQMLARGHTRARAAKLYTCHSTGRMGLTERRARQNVWHIAAEVGYTGPVVVHAEDHEAFGPDPFRPEDPPSHSRHQNAEAELAGVVETLADAMAAGFAGTVVLAHTSGANTVDQARWWVGHWKPPFKVAFEVTWHHLFLNADDDYPVHGNRVKMNPPLRSRANQEMLLGQLLEAPADFFVGTDHAPHPLAAKDRLDPHPASGIPAIPFWPKGIKLLRDRGLDEDALRHVTFGHANAVFGLGLEGFEVETTYKISAWERYGWNSFSRLGA